MRVGNMIALAAVLDYTNAISTSPTWKIDKTPTWYANAKLIDDWYFGGGAMPDALSDKLYSSL